MSSQDVMDFANGLGVHVVLKQFEGPPPCHEVCIYAGLKESGDMGCWSDAVFLREELGGWSIGFSQSSRTRVLQDGELRELLKAWVSGQDRTIFRAYEKA